MNATRKKIIDAIMEALTENNEAMSMEDMVAIAVMAEALHKHEPAHCELCAIQQTIAPVMDLVVKTAPRVEAEQLKELVKTPEEMH